MIVEIHGFKLFGRRKVLDLENDVAQLTAKLCGKSGKGRLRHDLHLLSGRGRSVMHGDMDMIAPQDRFKAEPHCV